METRGTRFEAETLLEGIDVYGKDLSPRLHFTEDSYNINHALGEGIGPRYGMEPLPGHMHTESLGADLFGGLMHSEGSGTYAWENRKKCFSIQALTLGTYDDITVERKHFIFVGSSIPTADTILDYAINVENDGGNANFASDIAEGFTWENLSTAAANRTRYRRLRPDPSDYRKIDSGLARVETAVFQKRGREIRQGYWFGPVDSSYPDTANRFGLPAFGAVPAGVNYGYGQPPSFNRGDWAKGDRSILAWSLNSSWRMDVRWRQSITIDADSYEPTINSAATTSLDSSWPNATPTARDDGTGYVVGTTFGTLIFDPELTISSQYISIMSAANKAVMAIIQEHERGDDRQLLQWIDPTSPVPFVRQFTTLEQGTANFYTEDSREKQTCWRIWPKIDYTTTTTPTRASLEAGNLRNGANHVSLGGNNSGLLRANTRYQFAYSIYDYSLDHETNVGEPGLVVTGTDDFVCLYLMLQSTTTGGTPNPGVNDFLQDGGAAMTLPFPAFLSDDNMRRANYMEYRVYYREEGTFEWLPAGKIPFPKLYFFPDLVDFAVCQFPIAALPGGQPGGFIDNSPLPADRWDSVVVFNKRVFWSSKRQVSYSLADNTLAYPARNSISCPRGEFRGLLVHTFYGESEQTGRLLIFGSEEYYFAEFTGQFQTFPVRVSADVVSQFPADGSDLVVKLRSTITAFSSKAAVVADGILYFWGPDGIFYDNGVKDPVRISQDLEPELQKWYDKADTANIHCVYNKTTKEVLWFFKPSTARGSEETHVISYHVKYDKFCYFKMGSRIDWAQPLNIDNTDRSRAIDSQRVVIGTREDSSGAISRPVFFDQRCNSGDFHFNRHLMVKEIVDDGGGTYRFVLASGYDTGDWPPSSPSSDGLVSAPSMSDFTESATAVDGIFRLASKVTSPAAVRVKTDTTLTAEAFDQDKYFPIYIDDWNEIPWLLQTNQWSPVGLRDYWEWYWCHAVYRVGLLTFHPDSSVTTWSDPGITFEYRSNHQGTYASREIIPSDNSNGYYQVVTHFVPADMVHMGQSMQFRFSANQYGGRKQLEYFAMEGKLMGVSELQTYEG